MDTLTKYKKKQLNWTKLEHTFVPITHRHINVDAMTLHQR